jgi:triacylglycerol lipase
MRILLLVMMLAVPGAVSYGRMHRTAHSEVTTVSEVVFLLHGICKSRADMWAMQRYLQKRGYEVVNWGYPSRKYPVAELADMFAAEVARHPAERMHFVTHSMGGIVVRTYISRHQPGNLGRFVMIGTPNQGAEFADFLRDWRIYHGLFGPAGQELCTDANSACTCAGKPPCEFGIIAGGLNNRVGFNPFLPGDNDGIVTVDSTLLEGAADTVRLPHMHLYIQMMPGTLRAAARFLCHGNFSEECNANGGERCGS